MKRTFAILLFSSLFIPRALAEEPPIQPPVAPALQAPLQVPTVQVPVQVEVQDYDKATIVAFASSTAVQYGLNPEHFINVIEHESHFSNKNGEPSPTGDYGYCQINAASWPKITRAEMLNPYWCIPWMAQAWANGDAHWWTQWRILYG